MDRYRFWDKNSKMQDQTRFKDDFKSIFSTKMQPIVLKIPLKNKLEC